MVPSVSRRADVYPEVLASTADVLVAVLTPAAGNYSVPSKVLSYLWCEPGRSSASSRSTTTPGRVWSSGQVPVWCSRRPRHTTRLRCLDHLRDELGLRADMGRAGRRHAEAHFRIGPIVDRFEAVLDGT